MSDEGSVRRAIEGAGGSAVGPDRYLMAGPEGSGRVFVDLGRGKNRSFQGLLFKVSIAARTSRPVELAWLPCLELIPEDAGHRSAKAHGRARELQSGDPELDDRVYVSTAARDAEVAPLLALPAFRKAALALFDAGAVRIDFANGRRPRVLIVPDPRLFEDGAALARLAAAAGDLEAALPAFADTRWKPRLGPAGLLTWAAALGAPSGALGAMIATDYWETVSNDLAWHAAFLSLIPYGLLVAVARGRARRSSRGVSRLWTVILAGAIAMPTWAIFAAHALNAELDPSLSMRSVVLEKKYAVRQGKSTYLYARLAPWPPLTEAVVMGLQGHTYDSLPTNGPIQARIGDGLFGYTWVEDLYPPP